MKHILLLILTSLMLVSCSAGNNKASMENTFVIVDTSSNKILSLYETDEEDRIVRTETYQDGVHIKRSRDFQYDTNGYVRQMTERSAGKAERTVHYTNNVVRDTDGRIEKVTTIDSDGKKIESQFGYDEYGVLRGTMVTVNDDSIMMKDYYDD